MRAFAVQLKTSSQKKNLNDLCIFGLILRKIRIDCSVFAGLRHAASYKKLFASPNSCTDQ